VPPGQCNRLNKPFIQQRAIGQIGEKVVLGQMGHFFRQFPRGGDIVENQHCAGDFAVPVVNGGGRVFDPGLGAIATDQHNAGSHGHYPVFRECHFRRILCGLSGKTVEDMEHFGKRPAHCLLLQPPGHLLRDHIHISDVARHVGGEYRVADGVERDRARSCSANNAASADLRADMSWTWQMKYRGALFPSRTSDILKNTWTLRPSL